MGLETPTTPVDRPASGETSLLLSLPFDHYQRYQLTKKIVSIVRPGGTARRLRILDVGGSHGTLKHFLPDDEVVIADVQPPPPFSYRESVPFLCDSYLLASGGDLPFADASFDIVTAHDTLEHVPDASRSRFLSDLLRVADRYVIVNGPVYDPQTAEAERRLAVFMERAFSGSNCSLDEHIALGLPRKHEIEGLLREEGCDFVAVPNGNLQRWLAMMGLKHYLMGLPEGESAHHALDRTYNALISERDFGGLCYREAYVIAKRPAYADALEWVVAALPPAMDDVSVPTEASALESLLQALEEHASSVRGALAGQREQIRELRDAANAVRAEIRRRDVTMDVTMEERDRRLAALNQALTQANQQLAAIHSSLGYRLVEAYRRRVRWLFPPGSHRAVPYRALRRAVDWSLYRAPWRGVRSSVGGTRRLTRRSREIIRREGWRAFFAKARRRLRGTRVPATARPIDYEQWTAANEPDAADLERQRRTALKLPYRPLISIVTPVWNPPLESLHQTIESVVAQTYDNWELCVVDGGSTDPEIKRTLEEFASGDQRIHIKLLDKNLGISGNSNEALALGSGEFVTFLDHTDLLAPNALWEVVSLLNRNPQLDCVYSDEDLISEDGLRRFNPFFKPQWSPDLLLSANYLAHLCVARRQLVEEMGGERGETDGAQDWDLFLRMSERTQRFARIPKVLYHWRADATSAVISLDNKPYAVVAQIRALQEHLDRRGLSGLVERDDQGVVRVRWRTSGSTKVSIIIPTRHNRKLLERCLAGIARSTYRNWEIIVVETATRDRDRELWYEQAQNIASLTVLWWDKPFNYSAVNNHGASASRGDALLFLNDDTEALSDEWLDEIVGWLEQPGIGAVGAQLLSPNGAIQHGGDVLGLNGFADHLFSGAQERGWTPMGFTGWYRNVLATTGACLMMKRDTFESLGGFDENFLLCGSDVELCLRIHRAGLRTVVTPFARVLHVERATRGSSDYVQDCFTSYWHYQSYLHGGDPYFSANLSLLSSVPQLRHPEEPTAAAVVAKVLGRNVAPQRPNSARIEVEAAEFAEACQTSPGEVDATRRLHQENRGRFEVKSVNWFIPDFESPFYGGIHTILRFADHFKREFGVTNHFVVLGSGPEPYIRSGLRAAFPALADSGIRISSLSEDELDAHPQADASVASLWVTAYAVSKFKRTKRKFYLVQDFEPVFYPAGTLYALSEATYRLGLYGLANTATLKRIYESEYGGKAVDFTPCVDTSLFKPPEGRRHEDDTLTLFLYGRPGHWRNCYELAIAAIERLKRRLKQRVRVVTAGSWARSGDSESAYLVDNLGLLDYKETANLYRECDVGLVLSVSKHPSYLPLELMASGALVVSNLNTAGYWLLHDGENCLLAEPTAESLSAALEKGLLDVELRQRLTDQALKDIQRGHSDWRSQMNRVYEYMCAPESA